MKERRLLLQDWAWIPIKKIIFNFLITKKLCYLTKLNGKVKFLWDYNAIQNLCNASIVNPHYPNNQLIWKLPTICQFTWLYKATNVKMCGNATARIFPDELIIGHTRGGPSIGSSWQISKILYGLLRIAFNLCV